MISLTKFINEKHNFLVKGHTKKQCCRFNKEALNIFKNESIVKKFDALLLETFKHMWCKSFKNVNDLYDVFTTENDAEEAGLLDTDIEEFSEQYDTAYDYYYEIVDSLNEYMNKQQVLSKLAFIWLEEKLTSGK